MKLDWQVIGGALGLITAIAVFVRFQYSSAIELAIEKMKNENARTNAELRVEFVHIVTELREDLDARYIELLKATLDRKDSRGNHS